MRSHISVLSLFASMIFTVILGLAGIAPSEDNPSEPDEEIYADAMMYPTREPGSIGNNDIYWDFNNDGSEDFFRAVLYDEGMSSGKHGPIKAVIKYFRSENGEEPKHVKTYGTYRIPWGIGMRFLIADLNKDRKKDVIFTQFITEHPEQEKWYAIYMQKNVGEFEHVPFGRK